MFFSSFCLTIYSILVDTTQTNQSCKAKILLSALTWTVASIPSPWPPSSTGTVFTGFVGAGSTACSTVVSVPGGFVGCPARGGFSWDCWGCVVIGGVVALVVVGACVVGGCCPVCAGGCCCCCCCGVLGSGWLSPPAGLPRMTIVMSRAWPFTEELEMTEEQITISSMRLCQTRLGQSNQFHGWGTVMLKFKSWQKKNHTENASQHHFYCSMKETVSVTAKVPLTKFSNTSSGSAGFYLYPSS